ncbi:MAG: PBP1A family penicillin-binding protein [Bauldia sp.]|nr:PBP1A family penicillin-binding protein [Bauldia sp.]
MARNRRRVERIEPALRGKTNRRAGDLDIGLDEADRPGGSPRPRRSASTRARVVEVIEPDGRTHRTRGPKKRKPGVLRRAFRWFLLISAVLFLAGMAVLGYYASKLPNITTWAVPERPPNYQILAADGTLIANRGDTGGENVTLEELPDYVAQAIIAAEDRRFYGHPGVDPIGLVRVVYTSVTSGNQLAGASTITQQLARTLFLTTERSTERKIQEAILAVWLEVQYSKADILEMYLNRVYFGAGATGIDAAARRYFGKPATQLTLAEASTLAGILPAPARYAPDTNPDAARERQRLVLRSMVEEGYITQREADLAREGEVVAVSRASSSGSYIADWVAELVPDFVGTVRGDIIIDTTIDPRLQEMAANAVEARLAEQGEAMNVTQAALVSMSPDGAVRALVGGRDYAASQFNRAVNARRQPGSSFKPFVYLTALEHGLVPETVRVDQPVTINGWSPQNYSGEYLGPVSLQRALALSLNTVSVQLTQEVGAASVVATARRLGITTPMAPNPSIALGTSEVSVLDMTGAYAAFANGGNGVLPYVIRRITTEDGDVLYQRTGGGPGPAVDIQYVGMMNSMMRETLQSGTGRGAVINGWDAAGKTGTSQEFRDAWFIGYTSHLVTGVWVGNDDNDPTNRASGGNLPSAIFGEYMNEAHEGVTANPLPGNYLYRNANGYDPNAAPPQTILDAINAGGVPGGVAGQPYQALDGRWYQQGLNGQTYEVPAPGTTAAGVAPAGAVTTGQQAYPAAVDRYNPAYDPRYDPTAVPGAAPAGTQTYPAQTYPQTTYPQYGTGQVVGPNGVVQPPVPPGQIGNGQVVLPPTGVVQPPVQQQQPGFFRRLFGG